MKRALLIAAALLLAGPAEAKQRGLASYYGPGFHTKRMANGKRFNQNNPHIVAHRKLPLGTVVKVKANGRTLIATVEDRGPYVPGRILDLSVAGAEHLRTKRKGVAMVDVYVLKRPKRG